MEADGSMEVLPKETLRNILQKMQKTDFDVARGISIIEDYRVDIAMLDSLHMNPDVSGMRCIGITGSPGVGKSTFINRFLSTHELSHLRVAVIAIDPSSRISQGAVLGDRIRINNSEIFEQIYFRSMATRGAYGGLNHAIRSVLFFLSQCGFTLVLVETVGVGQNEIEIVNSVDQVIHIVDSNVGDEVQMDKSGVMEIGDVFFVNQRIKSEDPKFKRFLDSLAFNSNRLSGKSPIVIAGSAVSGEGFDEIALCLNLPLVSSK